jgi:glycosyltransferase involved in cell wall biosynthesis
VIDVAFDVTPLRQTRAGTARHIRGLLRAFGERDDVRIHERAFGGASRFWNVPRDAVWYPFVSGRTRSADVLHCPTYRGPVTTRIPLVVTVHDLALFRHPEAFNVWSRVYGPRVIPRVLRAATRIIAVSEFTKRELVDVLRVDEAKIRVIPNAIEATFTREGPAADGEYVLAVGTVEPRKNLARIADAVQRTGMELRIIGARGWGDVRWNGNGVRWLGDVDDSELARQYRGAQCVAYASLYEGFGIPVLEAMACGAPVVTSRATATAEIAEDAAVLVDPNDADDIAEGIRRAIAQRSELVARGLERARAFNWSDVAEATVAVYREAAG